MKIKYIIIGIVCIALLQILVIKSIYATCDLTGGLNNWTLTSNCTLSGPPAGWNTGMTSPSADGAIYSVSGQVEVGPYTVTVQNNNAIVTDWLNDSMNFTTGRVLLNGNAAIHDALSFSNTPYSENSQATNCSADAFVWNPITQSSSGTVHYASRSGYLICLTCGSLPDNTSLTETQSCVYSCGKSSCEGTQERIRSCQNGALTYTSWSTCQ